MPSSSPAGMRNAACDVRGEWCELHIIEQTGTRVLRQPVSLLCPEAESSSALSLWALSPHWSRGVPPMSETQIMTRL